MAGGGKSVAQLLDGVGTLAISPVHQPNMRFRRIGRGVVQRDSFTGAGTFSMRFEGRPVPGGPWVYIDTLTEADLDANNMIKVDLDYFVLWRARITANDTNQTVLSAWAMQ